jgi:small-conductance mechanosensitive channel
VIDRTGTGISDWWDQVVSWFDKPDNHLVRIVAILIGAIVVWILGRLTIRMLIRSLRKGIPKTRHRLPRLVRRAAGTTPQDSMEARLEAERLQRRAKTIGTVLRSIWSVIVVAFAAMAILAEFGVQIGALVATAGILGVALGFGAQSLVKDVLAGVFILSEDQYGEGDIIDVGEASGVVEEIGLRITRLRSLDGTVWFVPNGEIRRVGNKSRLWSRAMIEIRIDPGADVEDAKEAILEAASAAVDREDIAPVVLGDPTVPGVETITRDAMMLRVFVQVRPGNQWDVERAIRAEVHRVFKKRKIRLAVGENRIYLADGE